MKQGLASTLRRTGGAGLMRWLLGCALLALAPAAVLGATHVVIITGQGGDPEYQKRFREQSTAVSTAARKLVTEAGGVTVLEGDSATRDSIRAEFRKLSGKVQPDDQVMVVLIGHGTFDGQE